MIGDIEYFLFFTPGLGKMHLVPESAASGSIHLWLTDPNQPVSRSLYAIDFEFDRNWPPSTASPAHRRHDHRNRVSSLVADTLDEHGINYVIPSGDSSGADIHLGIAENTWIPGAIHTVQEREGRIFFHLDERDSDPDIHLLECRTRETIYVVQDELVDSSLSLWVREPKQVQRTTLWAADFELESVWPPDPAGPLPRRSLLGTAVTAFEAVDARVAIPRGDEPFDLLAAPRNGEFLRVGIEPGWVSSGRIRLKPDRRDDVDAYLVHCRSLDEQYLVHADEFDVSISLRVDPPKRHASMTHPAHAYALAARWPITD